MPRKLLIVLAGLLLATGCAAPVSGAPTSASDSDEPLTVAAFGDAATIDPCSLTSDTAFKEHGHATLPGRAGLDSCRVSVTTGGGKVTVDVGLLQRPETLPEEQKEVRTLPRGASLVHVGSKSDGVCSVALVLSDDVSLLSMANADPEAVSDRVLCGVAEGGAEGAFQVLSSGKVKHWEPQEDSLVNVTACDVLDAEQVAELLGITSERIARYPAGHQCRWGRTGGDTATAKLDFSVALDEYDAGAPQNVAPEQLGGRPSWVADVPTGDILICAVVTEHIEFGNGIGEREYATLRVVVPATAAKNPCTIARTLAGTGWAELPAVT